jgi:S1-C subfamily serine protease
MNNALSALSDAVAGVAAAASPLLCAIRTGPNRHITGLIYHGDAIVTTDQALPVMDGYTAILSDRSMTSLRPGPRDPTANLAVLRLDQPVAVTAPDPAAASVGCIVVVLGADLDASPTVRLGVIHRFLRTADGPAPVLDLPGDAIEPGGPVLDPAGRLIGIAALGQNNEAMVIPAAAIERIIAPGLRFPAQAQALTAPLPQPQPPPASLVLGSGRRGWLGVALQPITVPDQLIGKAGQTSGRMVVNVTTGGPADLAGLRTGDVLLALDNTSTTGPHALRAFLGADRIGSKVEVRLLRDGKLLTTHLVVAMQPG